MLRIPWAEGAFARGGERLLGGFQYESHSTSFDSHLDTKMSAFDVILHPTDFSAESDQAFQLACSVARDHFAKLVVLHVIPPSTFPDGDIDPDLLSEDRPAVRHCREQFDRLRALAGDVPLTFRLVLGYPVGMILNVARQEDAELIVIASHQHSQFHFQLHGSVAEGVLRQAHCPVLCLRQPNPGVSHVSGHRRERADTLN